MKFKEFYQNNIILEYRETIANVKIPIRINIDNVDLIATNHSQERTDRHGPNDIIDNKEIINTLERAFPQIFQDFANGELANNAEFVVKNKITDLNVVAAITMKPGPDQIRVVTVIRKRGFVAKSGTAKVYTV